MSDTERWKYQGRTFEAFRCPFCKKPLTPGDIKIAYHSHDPHNPHKGFLKPMVLRHAACGHTWPYCGLLYLGPDWQYLGVEVGLRPDWHEHVADLMGTTT